MRQTYTAQTVAILAQSAGFEFSLERCELLAPQLESILAQAGILAAMRLDKEEPLSNINFVNMSTLPSKDI